MTQLEEAVVRYHKIIEAEAGRSSGWLNELISRMEAHHLTEGGRPVSPVLRPNFITPRQYQNLTRASELLSSAVERVERMALENPALLARLGMLPAEKMLATLDPGYPFLAVTSLLDTYVQNGSLRLVDYSAEAPAGVATTEALNEVFYDTPPMKQFRTRYKVAKVGGAKALLAALLKAYKAFGARQAPRIGILENRQAFQKGEAGELRLLAEFFRQHGYPCEVVSPDQLDYRGGVLRKGDFVINLLYRRVRISEFLTRYSLSHLLVRAYREHAVCMVNSFRSELAQKRALFDLLTDEAVTAQFPAAEKKVIRELIPWTRLVRPQKVTYQGETVDLLEFIVRNREKLALKPNDEGADLPIFVGARLDAGQWERALKTALRHPYVVQEVGPAVTATFPVNFYGSIEFREMEVEVHPHSFLGKIEGCSSWLKEAAAPSGFSSLSGPAPTYLLEPK